MKKVDKDTDLKVTLNFMCKDRRVGDLDNISKPILDILQIYGVIDNDRKIVELTTSKTFGHDANYIEIELEERR